MFGLKWLVDHDALPKEKLEEYYASYVAGIFRTLRFGTGEAHGRAEMMEFNYLLENRRAVARSRTLDRRLRQDACRARRSGEDPARLSRRRAIATKAESWFAKYGKMPAELTKALEGTRGHPRRPRAGVRLQRGSAMTVTRSKPSSTAGGTRRSVIFTSASSGTTRVRPALRARQTSRGVSKKTASTAHP